MTKPSCKCWIFNKELDGYITIVPLMVKKDNYEEFYGYWWSWLTKCPYCGKEAIQ